MKTKKIIGVVLLALLFQTVLFCGAWRVPAALKAGAQTAYERTPVGVGNQNSYSSGGGSSSRSGSSSHSSSSSRSGSYSSSGSHRSGSSSDDDSLVWLLGLMALHPGKSAGVIVVIIVVLVLWSRQQKRKKNAGDMGPLTQYQSKGPADLTPLEAIDPEFSTDQFISWSKEVFVTLNRAWTEKDWSKIRPFESDTLFREHSQLLEDYIRDGKTNVLDRVAVKDAVITDYYEDSQNEYLEVTMQTNMIDYVVVDKTGEVTAGDKTTLWNVEYTLKFMRSRGVKTAGAMEGMATVNCPNCGAPTEVTSSGQCEYCKSVITTGKYNWVLCSYTGRNL